MAAALFRHIASRNLDPQLHTHAVVANMTRDGEGRWKSIEPTELHRNAILIGAYYRDQLARRLIGKGYSILPAMAGRMRSFEIAGYDRRVQEAFSTRRKEMEAYMDEKGWDHDRAAAQIAALATRKRKAEPLHAMLRTIWAARAEELGEAPIVRRSRGPVSLPAVPSALKIAWQAMRHLEERQSVFAAHHLEALVLGHSPGRHTLEEVRSAIGCLVRDAHLVEARLRNSDRSFVTDRALKAERAVIAAMKTGIGDGMALAVENAVAAHLAAAGLTEGQKEAVRTILLTPDRIVGVQGRAGTGKTTMLRHVRELAGKRFVMGLAPSTAAARVLKRETGMATETLQWFLARCRAVDDGGSVIDRLKEQYRGAVLVLDEASMVSTDQMKRLMQIAEELEVARLVLVGDRSQLRAVEAGQPFRQLQKAGMTTAEMNEILRQRTPKLRGAVTAVLEGEPGEAVELLGSSVHEVPWDELGQKAAEAWLELDPETRSRTLLVAPTHELRAEINAAVRGALAAEGVLRGKALRIDRLVGLGMTRAEMADVRNYREGDTVLFNQDQVNYRVRKDEALTVTGIERDRLLLLHPDGRPRHVVPERGRTRYRLEVYETRPIEIRAGDRIRWTRNDRKRDLVNGEQAEVAAITKDRVRFLLADGRKLSLRHGDPQLRHLDHAWSSTVHGAQGSTADGVIAVLDSGHGALTDQSTFYVEISRARDSAVVLTDNCEQLVEVLEAHTGERATALEAVGEEIGPDAEIVSVPEQLPIWSPREEWTALEEKARNEGTILFRVEGYGELIERTRALVAEYPDLPAPVREVADGLLAYDRNCREGDGGAAEFLGLLDTPFRTADGAGARGGGEGPPACRAGGLPRLAQDVRAAHGERQGPARRRGRARRRGGAADRRAAEGPRRPARPRRCGPEVRGRPGGGQPPGGRGRHDPVLCGRPWRARRGRPCAFGIPVAADRHTGGGRGGHRRGRGLRAANSRYRGLPRRDGRAGRGTWRAGGARRRRAADRAGGMAVLGGALGGGGRALAVHARQGRRLAPPSRPARGRACRHSGRYRAAGRMQGPGRSMERAGGGASEHLEAGEGRGRSAVLPGGLGCVRRRGAGVLGTKGPDRARRRAGGTHPEIRPRLPRGARRGRRLPCGRAAARQAVAGPPARGGTPEAGRGRSEPLHGRASRLRPALGDGARAPDDRRGDPGRRGRHTPSISTECRTRGRGSRPAWSGWRRTNR